MKRLVTLEIPEGRLAEIFDKLHKAEQEISDCYNELRYLGVMRIKEAPFKEDDAPEKTINSLDAALDKLSLEQEAHDNICREFENFCNPIHEPAGKATHGT